MAKVFLSYSRRDSGRVDVVRSLLTSEGHSLLLDVDLALGENWKSRIGALLQEADVVLVLWSHSSVSSALVMDEASYGLENGKLLPVLIDDVPIPLGFHRVQHAPLMQWTGETKDPQWLVILDSIKVVADRTKSGAAAATADRPMLRAEQNFKGAPGSIAPVDSDRKYLPLPATSMISIFVAHASGDKPRLGGVIEALAQIGFALWIDKPHLIPCSHETRRKISRIHMGDDWKESIRQAVSKADKVMAFWSDDAIDAKREQFQYEVYQGLVQSKLFQCKLDPMPQDKIGFPYTFHQIADLSDFKDGAYHYELDYLMQDIVRPKALAKRKSWLFG